MANREAFHSLLQKLRPMSNLGEVFTVRPSGSVIGATGMRMSCVSVVMLASVNRIASAPWLSMVIQRVDAVAEALGHLAALAVLDHRVDVHVAEGDVARAVLAHHHHAARPTA